MGAIQQALASYKAAASGSLGFTYKDAAGGTGGASFITTIPTGTSLTVATGDLLAVFFKHDGTVSSDSVTDTLGNTYTKRTGESNVNYGSWYYCLSALSGTSAISGNTSASRQFCNIIAFQFSYVGTPSYDGESIAFNSPSTAVSSGSFSAGASGAVDLILGGYVESSGALISSQQVGGVAADGTFGGGGGVAGYTASWYRSVSGAFTGAAAATINSANSWGCCAMAIKVV